MCENYILLEGVVPINRVFLIPSLFVLLFSISQIATAEDAAKHEIEQALSKEANLDNGKKVFETCSLCHSPEGWGSTIGRFPQIAGQHKSVIIKQLADIRAGNRDNPTMFPFTQANILKDAQTIEDVAAYISKLPMTRSNGKGSGLDLALGEQIFKKHCTTCHGASGEGDEEEFYPRIQGQHYLYIFRQLRWIKSGKRRNADPKMAKLIHNYSLRELSAVSDYVSRLSPPDELLAKPGWKNPDFNPNLLNAQKVQRDLQSVDQAKK